MTGDYKFLKSEHVDGLVKDRNIRFGRLNYYRLLEVATGDQWIGDKTEGIAETKVETEYSAEKPDPVAEQRLKDAGLLSSTDGITPTVSITGTVIHDHVDCFVFSFSRGEFDKLRAVMCNPDRPDYSYDACVQILNAEALVTALRENGRVGLGGERLSEHFDVEMGRVRYDRAVHDFSVAGVAPGDPLVKDARYEEQSEVRIILLPKGQVRGDFVFVRLPFAESPFAEVARDLAVVSLAPGDDRTEEELLRVLKEAFESIDRVERDRDGTPEEREERRRIYEVHFDQHLRLPLSKAWFALRRTRPSSKMDWAIASSFPAKGIWTRLEDYLSGDHRGGGPTPLVDPTFPKVCC
jgi:hypothetical protein